MTCKRTDQTSLGPAGRSLAPAGNPSWTAPSRRSTMARIDVEAPAVIHPGGDRAQPRAGVPGVAILGRVPLVLQAADLPPKRREVGVIERLEPEAGAGRRGRTPAPATRAPRADSHAGTRSKPNCSVPARGGDWTGRWNTGRNWNRCGAAERAAGEPERSLTDTAKASEARAGTEAVSSHSRPRGAK